MNHHVQHIADFYSRSTWLGDSEYIAWDNYMRDSLGVERLTLDALIDRLHPVLKRRKLPGIDKRSQPVKQASIIR